MADHDDLDPEIGRFLRERAAAGERAAAPVTADDALAHPLSALATEHRRHPAFLGVAAALVLLAAVAGFAAGRGSAPKRGTTVVAHGDTQSSEPSLQSGTATYATGGGTAYGSSSGPALTKLFIRTTADGVTLRAFIEDDSGYVQPATTACPTGQWCPPPECSPITALQAEISAAGFATNQFVPLYPAGESGAYVQSYELGGAEGAPAKGATVHVADGITHVKATWPDGVVDEMDVVSGWAIVAAQETTDPTIELTHADGTVTTADEGSYQMPAACTPPPPAPPTLPAAGEQPADVAAATDGVKHAFTTVYTAGADKSANKGLIQAYDELQPLFDQLKSNFSEATSTVTVELGDLVFTSPTEAYILFELQYSGGALFGQQLGHAVYEDGTWKIARDTSCLVIGWGGVSCP